MASGPKQKTRRSAAKRFRTSSKGKIKRERAFLTHLRWGKNRKRKRRLRQQTYVKPPEQRKVSRMLGKGK